MYQHDRPVFKVLENFYGLSYVKNRKTEENGKRYRDRLKMYDIEINDNGIKHPIYKNKKKKFNTPAFNFDEVATLPENSTLLASNPTNKVKGVNFKYGISDIWGIQYHPEITYSKMINLIHFRKDRLIEKKAFSDQSEIDQHVKIIEKENKVSDKNSRMQELKNWLDYLNAN